MPVCLGQSDLALSSFAQQISSVFESLLHETAFAMLECYPTVEQVADRLREASERLGLVQNSWYVSLFDGRVLSVLSASELDNALVGMPERLRAALAGLSAHVSAYPTGRRSASGMLLAASTAWGIASNETVYRSNLDAGQQAATAVGMRFALT
jgi:hypothetical protein